MIAATRFTHAADSKIITWASNGGTMIVHRDPFAKAEMTFLSRPVSILRDSRYNAHARSAPTSTRTHPRGYPAPCACTLRVNTPRHLLSGAFLTAPRSHLGWVGTRAFGQTTPHTWIEKDEVAARLGCWMYP